MEELMQLETKSMTESGVSEQIAILYEELRQDCFGYVTEIKRSTMHQLDLYRAEAAFSMLKRVAGTAEHLRTALSQSGDSETLVFWLSTEMLIECYRELSKQEAEAIVYGIGSRCGQVYTIERMVALDLDESKIAYARANTDHCRRILLEADEQGSFLTCCFHAHPVAGPRGIKPSSVDLEGQDKLESGGYRTIGCIYSRDGYLRFFSSELKFRLIITGKGVEHVSENTYRITETSYR